MTGKEKMLQWTGLAIQAGTDHQANSFTPEPVGFRFIYGAGSSGLTSFESSIAELDHGGEVKIELAGAEIREFFGALWGALAKRLGIIIIPEQLHLKVRLDSIEKAEPREIVEFMAGSMKGGCGCGDGCGCG